jgi:hypothetical protein
MRTYLSLRAVASWARPNRWADLRGADRVAADGQFAGLGVGGSYFVVPLFNWSDEGVCVEARGVQRLGERVKVTTNRLNKIGRVCWIANGRVGIEFDQPFLRARQPEQKADER